MKLNNLYFFFLLFNINYINSTYTIDFSFLTPDYNNNTIIYNVKR